jgi:hypothetical protein
LPVIRQPPAGWQTFVPLPRSTQSRVQQFEPLSQGVPSWPQPPGASSQRPGVVAVAPAQSPEQQSSPRAQTSPGAWQA